MSPDDRYHIETRLGRELTAEDLVEVASFDDLTREQLAVVARIVPNGILASAYVRQVVPSAGFSDARDFVMTIEDFIARKYPPAQLPLEHLYERALGRPLTDEERRMAGSIANLAPAQVAVARQLATGEDHAYALVYLADVARSSSSPERIAFVDSLRREGEP